MRIIAFIREKPTIKQILSHIGEPTKSPVLSPPRAPPLWEEYLTDTEPECIMPDSIPNYSEKFIMMPHSFLANSFAYQAPYMSTPKKVTNRVCE